MHKNAIQQTCKPVTQTVITTSKCPVSHAIAFTVLFFYLFFIFMYVWRMADGVHVGMPFAHAWLLVYWGTHVHGCVCMWKPKVDVRNHPPLFFYLIQQDKVFSSNPELTNVASLAFQFAPGIPHLHLPKLDSQEGFHVYLAVMWVLGI